MSLRRLAVLQWIGLLAGASTWTVDHLAGVGITQAECNVAGRHWSISNPWWQGTLMAVAAVLVIASGTAAVLAFVRTRGNEFGSGPMPPEEKDDVKPGRIHFFSAAAIVTNVILLMIILLDGSANLANIACRQS
jgi:hypothetical protein